MFTKMSDILKPIYLLVAVMSFAGFYLLRVATDSERFSGGEQWLALIVGAVLFLVAFMLLYRNYTAPAPAPTEPGIQEPRVSRFLFSSAQSAPLWLGARIYLGWEWIDASRHKLTDDAWMDTGVALKGFWSGALAVNPETGENRISYSFFEDFIQYMLDHEWYTWFAPLIAIGELLVGLGLILGALTGIAAFFGALMNMSFMLAGTVSTNPVLFLLSIFMILGWRVVGLIGLDRWLLPFLGAPWQPGRLIRREQPTPGYPQTPAAAGHK
jgi:thiosulfate dehydrogenase [quinone] large subunit